MWHEPALSQRTQEHFFELNLSLPSTYISSASAGQEITGCSHNKEFGLSLAQQIQL
jgi:hypothetical protein